MTTVASDAPLSLVPEHGTIRTERHLRLVPTPSRQTHDHTWSLRETEYDDLGLIVRRFECDCGGVSYR